MPDMCTDCVKNLYLLDGLCVWPTCDDWHTKSAQGGWLYSARCVDCADGYGVHHNGVCYPCDNPDEPWDRCTDCVIGDNYEAVTCTDCE